MIGVSVISMLVLVIAVMMQSDTVEFFKWICNLAHRGCETRIQWNALDLCDSNVNTLAFLDIPEVGRLDALALMRNDGGLHVS